MKQAAIAFLIALAVGAGIGLVIGVDATQGQRLWILIGACIVLAGAAGVAVYGLNRR